MLSYLDDLKKKMSSDEKNGGKAIERAELVLNTNNSEEIMINHNTPQTGQDYEKKLNSYVTDLNRSCRSTCIRSTDAHCQGLR